MALICKHGHFEIFTYVKAYTLFLMFISIGLVLIEKGDEENDLVADEDAAWTTEPDDI